MNQLYLNQCEYRQRGFKPEEMNNDPQQLIMDVAVETTELRKPRFASDNAAVP